LLVSQQCAFQSCQPVMTRTEPLLRLSLRFLDLTLETAGADFFQRIPKGWNAFVYVLQGEVQIGDAGNADNKDGGSSVIKPYHIAILNNDDDLDLTLDGASTSSPSSTGQTGVRLTAVTDQVRAVVVAGEPLDQPIVQHGTFTDIGLRRCAIE
jgi:redox-sensitive bicupin YhaK (pirin superfamily)